MENKSSNELKAKSQFALWVQAVRPFSFTASVVPVIITGMLAFVYSDVPVLWGLFPLILFCGMTFHFAGNLISEYYDFINKVDRYDTFGSSRVLVEDLLSPKKVRNVGIALLSISFLLGLILVYFRGLPILYMGLGGAVLVYFYGAKPFQLKYIALGDLAIFIGFGPLLFIGAYYGLTGTYHPYVFYSSIPIGFLVVAILHANNTRDIMHDTQAKIKTLASIFGINGAKFEYYFLEVGAYLAVIVLVILKILPPWTLIVFLSLPPFLANMRMMTKAETQNPSLIAILDVKTAQHHMMFGVLMAIGILLKAII